MKKICFITSNLNNSGGTERVGTELANHLAKRGYKIVFVNISDGRSPFFKLHESIKNISLFDKPAKTLYRTPKIIYRLRKILKEEQVDVVIDIEAMKVLFTLPASIGLPITRICWEHFNFKNIGHLGRKAARQLAALSYDHIVTLTERDKGYWLEGTRHNSQITTIPNSSPFQTQEYDYASKNCNNTVVAIGHLLPVKGFDLLLEAWNIVIRQKRDWKLIIVGEGGERRELEKYIYDNHLQESVELPGKTNNIEQYYREADILCLSSRFEGLPMVLIEALTFGIPIVSFDCDTGPAEILSNTGSILVPEGDTQQLAKSLIEMMNDGQRRKSISFKSKEKSKEYQPSEIIQKWIDLIES